MVIGASPNPERYAHRAVQSLREKGFPVVAVGLRKGMIGDVEIQTDRPLFEDIDTVTLYVGPAHQEAWQDYILSLKPRRLIFNPGTENPELAQVAIENGIAVEQACTLVLISLGEY